MAQLPPTWLTLYRDGAVRPLRRSELVAVDGLVAVVLTALFLALPGPAWSSYGGWSARLALAAAMGLPLALRRARPAAVCAVVTAASVVASVAGTVREPFLGVALALYQVAVTTPARRVPTPVIGAVSGGVLVLLLISGSPSGGGQDLVLHLAGLAVAGMAWVLGRAVRERRAHAARSARRVAVEAVTEERLRIARELHDIVAHHVGVIAVKAGVANHLLATHPEGTGEALWVIETASRSALTEMRQMLSVLRAGESEPEADGVDGLRPAPGLAALPELVAGATAAGLTAELRTEGTADLPQGVQSSAYRVVQEALTNVLKHAGPTRCRVDLVADGRELRIEVTDEGAVTARAARRAGHGGGYLTWHGPTEAAGHGSGHGLIGMRERVELFGGRFDAGPLSGGGFVVRAELPYRTAASVGEEP
ncbi:sensor histidine kinase [Kitasatospora sp. NPDC057542]|uniref:sensor histidine kinase n=1 Tax=Streptomycetaceae TaxID=2062 RepID=UPI001CCDC2D8|nr:histidine kinase [Streptomyces sp. LS1784]